MEFDLKMPTNGRLAAVLNRMSVATIAISMALAPAAARQGDPARGERVFQLCYACHSVDPRETGLPGPNLHGIVGRRAAALDGFDYSEALRAKAAEGLVWTREALDRYLSDPEAMIPGTAMAVNGVRDPAMRADLIAYLEKGAAGMKSQ